MCLAIKKNYNGLDSLSEPFFIYKVIKVKMVRVDVGNLRLFAKTDDLRSFRESSGAFFINHDCS